MPKYACRLFYLGTQYYGSQYQPSLPTIQGEIMQALTTWSGCKYISKSLSFSGRTDKGVHSLGQLVCFETDGELDIDQINKYLPEDIILWAKTEVPADFNPRHRVLFRHYRYYFDKIQSETDLTKVILAARELEGYHDFRLLSKPDGDRSNKAVLLNICMTKRENICVDFYGISFLWKLVRKIVTLLVEIGKNKIEPDTLKRLVQGNAPLPGGIEPAPAENLFLIEAVLPLRMEKSRNAVNIIKNRLHDWLAYFERYQLALKGISEDFVTEMHLY